MLVRRTWIAILGAMAMMLGVMAPFLPAVPAFASGCGYYQCTILHAIAAINSTDGGNDFSAWILGDYNHDGVLDLYGIKTKNTGSGHVEVHVLSGASDYRTWLLHAVLPISEVDGADDFSAWQLGYYEHSTVPDLYAIKTANTGSGHVEVHILTGTSNYSTFALHAVAPIDATDGASDFASWQVGKPSQVGAPPDLFAIKTAATGSGRVEVHELSGSSAYGTFTLHAVTAFLASTAPDFGAWQIDSFNGDGAPDLYGFATKQTGSGTVEVHLVSRSSTYSSFLLHATTSFSASTSSNYSLWAVGDFNGAGVLDLFGLQTANTSSGDVEMNIVNGVAPPSSTCTTLNACTPQTFADAIFSYPGIDAPATPSNEAAVEVWEEAEGGGAGCPGQAPFTSPWLSSAGPAGNPLNTTMTEPGSTNWNSVGVQVFRNYDNQTCWYWGVAATANTLLNGLYTNIIDVILTPNSNSYNQCVDLAQAVGQSPWGTGNFQADCSSLGAQTHSFGRPAAPGLGRPAVPLEGEQFTTGRQGAPHYELTLVRRSISTVSGTAAFVYQDGRVRIVDTYHGSLLPSGELHLTFDGGHQLIGSLIGGRIQVARCGTVLEGTPSCLFVTSR